MRRGWRKGVAFLLAVTMMTGCLHTTAWAAEEKTTDVLETIHKVTEVKYDSIEVFRDTVVLIENGAFEDGSFGFYKPRYAKSSLDTNLVFADENGNRKIISNNHNGETIFDFVYPRWYGIGDYRADRTSLAAQESVQIVKNDLVSYIKSDGTYFGDELRFYAWASVLNENLWLVSDDEITFRIVTVNGQTVLDNLKDSYFSVYYGKDYLFVENMDNVFVLDEFGNLISTEKTTGNGYIDTYKDSYVFYVEYTDSLYTLYVFNNGILQKKISAVEIDYNWTENGTIIYKYASSQGNYKYAIYDFEKDCVVFELDEKPKVSNGLFLNKRNGVEQIVDTRGNVYVENVVEVVNGIMERLGYDAYSDLTYFLEGDVLFVSITDLNAANMKTVLLYKENSFSIDKAVIVGGRVSQYTVKNGFFQVIGENNNYGDIYTFEGNLIEFDDNYKNSLGSLVIQSNQAKGGRGSELEGYMIVYVRDTDDNIIGERIIRSDGKVSDIYITIGDVFSEIEFYTYGTYFSAYKTESAYVILNEQLDVICQIEADLLFVCDIYNHIIVENEMGQSVYDASGNIIFNSRESGVEIYYELDDMRSPWNNFSENAILKNRLCVVKKETENGAVKYGVIKLGGTLNITNGLNQEKNGDWYYYINGVWANNYTGLVEHYGAWFYVEEGVLNWNYTGLVQHYDAWFYVENGQLNWGYTGLVNYNGIWFYVQNGQLNWGYTGLVQHYDAWFYVENGMLNWNYTGLVNYNDIWFYVENGQLNWGYTGLVQHYGAWFYVESGMLNWNYTGLVQYNGIWFYVENGQLNWNYTGLVQYYGAWFYIEGGMLNWNYTGLVQYYDAWFYVNGGQLDWSYTGLCEYNGVWFYIQGGQLNWGYTGTVYHNGIWWYVENGIVVRAA